MNVSKLVGLLVLLAGGILSFIGLAFVSMYFWEAIVSKIGDPDQSLVFWYLPILFLGVFGMLLGLPMMRYGTARLKNVKKIQSKGNFRGPA